MPKSVTAVSTDEAARRPHDGDRLNDRAIALPHDRETPDAVVQYARRFHAAVGPGHQIESPVGAWLVLALAATAASRDEAPALESVLGMSVDAAAAAAGRLLADPHPLVSAAAAVWLRSSAHDGLRDWLERLPPHVETGSMPGQPELDAWARSRTRGLIDRFPMAVDETVQLLLVSALATRVSWQVPFTIAPGTELGAMSPWSGLAEVLRTPSIGHTQYIADTAQCGDVAVHAARDRGGLLVVSVIAGADAPSQRVLAAAHEIAVGLADWQRPAARSLFDLPLGETARWTITERPSSSAHGREEHCTTVLPAWSARSTHDLTSAAGFAEAAVPLARLLRASTKGFEAGQTAVARYSRVGFEAAAITTFARATSLRITPDGGRRDAAIRFAHPYAVVAVATQPEPTPDRRRSPSGADPSPWSGMPVFSAWITDPESAESVQES